MSSGAEPGLLLFPPYPVIQLPCFSTIYPPACGSGSSQGQAHTLAAWAEWSPDPCLILWCFLPLLQLSPSMPRARASLAFLVPLPSCSAHYLSLVISCPLILEPVCSPHSLSGTSLVLKPQISSFSSWKTHPGHKTKQPLPSWLRYPSGRWF